MKLRMPNKTTTVLLGLGLGCYLLFLLITLPAGLIWQYAPSKTRQQIQLSGIQGTVWSGSAEQLYYHGQQIGKLHWSMRPWSLLWGNISFHARVKGLAGKVEGQFTLISDTELEASNVSADLYAEVFDDYTRKMFPVPIMLRGKVRANIASLQYTRGKTLHLTGSLYWKDASVEGVQSFPLGYVKFNAKPEKTGSQIKVQNKGGPLEINGNLILSANGHWNVNLGLLNRDKQRSDIASMLSFIGKPDTTGRYQLKRSGRLPL